MLQWLSILAKIQSHQKARRKDKDAAATSQEEHKVYLEQAVLECAVLTECQLKEVVELPPRLDHKEWLASHTIAFFDHINLIYGTISEFCTMSGCPDMTGPSNRRKCCSEVPHERLQEAWLCRQYLWFDEKGKKCKVAAPQYIDYVMTFTQKTVNDESIFPTKFDKDFPSSFESIVKKIHRLLFHVIAHMYHAHFRELLLLGLHKHLNSLFCHFVLFATCFDLVEPRETEVLVDLAQALGIAPPPEEPSNHLASQAPPPDTPPTTPLKYQ
ncbi:MOB2 [Cordylochernes scorpioides]|uniref:MOB2 n=1 Tax=Cordylochernes scorpioides TaxID=51811 RepID=A0ABY6LA02_9ARAC|nr:MOB2 [Cordylochernes scorpioides]